MKKLTLLFIVCCCFTTIAIAQPPPPHPGGSGNQGAPLAYYSLMVIGTMVATTAYKYKAKK